MQKIYFLFSNFWNFLQNCSLTQIQTTNLSRLKKENITYCILSDHHELNLDINTNTNNRKLKNHGNLTNGSRHNLIKKQ